MKHIFFIGLVITSLYTFTAEEPLKINSGPTVTEIEDPRTKTVLHFRKKNFIDPHTIINFKKPNMLFHELCAHAATLMYSNKYRCFINTQYTPQIPCEHLRLIIEALISIFHYTLRQITLSPYPSTNTQRCILLPLSVNTLAKASPFICISLRNNYTQIIDHSYPITRLTAYLWHALWSIPWYKQLISDPVFCTKSSYLKEPGDALLQNNFPQFLPNFGYFQSLCTTQGTHPSTTLPQKNISSDSIYAVITRYAETLTTMLANKNTSSESLANYATQVTTAFLQTCSQLCASIHDLEDYEKKSLQPHHQEFIKLVEHLLAHFMRVQLSTKEKNNNIQKLLYLYLYLSPSYCIMLKHPSFYSQKMSDLHTPSLQFLTDHLNPCIEQEIIYTGYQKYCSKDVCNLAIHDFKA